MNKKAFIFSCIVFVLFLVGGAVIFLDFNYESGFLRNLSNFFTILPVMSSFVILAEVCDANTMPGEDCLLHNQPLLYLIYSFISFVYAFLPFFIISFISKKKQELPEKKRLQLKKITMGYSLIFILLIFTTIAFTIDIFSPSVSLWFKLDTNGWVTYTNTKYNYSIKYPNDPRWPVDRYHATEGKVLDPEASILYIHGVTSESWDDPAGLYLTIFVCENLEDLSIQDWFWKKFNIHAMANPGGQSPCLDRHTPTQNTATPDDIVKKFQPTKVGGKDAVFWIYNERNHVYSVSHNQKIYILFTYPLEKAYHAKDLKKKVVENMISTFKFN